MKKVMLFVSIFGLFLISACTDKTKSTAAYVTMDINPSIGFTVDDQNRVVALEALNADGEVLLSNLEVEDLELDEAMQTLLDEAIDLGYIALDEEETTVEIDVVGENEELEDELQEEVTKEVEDTLDSRHIPHQVKEKTYQQDFVDEAKKLNMSPAHYRLMQQAMLLDPELTVEEATELHVNGLVHLINEHHGKGRGISASLKEEFLTAKEAIRTTYVPQIQELEEAIELAIANGEPTEELEAQLSELKDAMEQEIKTVVENYKTQSKAYRETLKEKHRERMESHHEKVEEFKNKHGMGKGRGKNRSETTTEPTEDVTPEE